MGTFGIYWNVTSTRLSGLEQEILYWLAIAREPIPLEELRADLLLPESRLKLTETLDFLKRRSLLEIISTGFTLQPAVMEYVTNRLIEGVFEEIVQLCGGEEAEGRSQRAEGEDAETRRHGDTKGKAEDRGQRGEGNVQHSALSTQHSNSNSTQNSKLKTQNPLSTPLLRNHGLIKATAKDYIREAQTRLILEPVAGQLRAVFDTPEDIKVALMQWIASLQGKPALRTGYIGGNILNLLCYLQVDLTDFDFSHLTLWQADLRRAILHGVNFTRSDLSRSAFTETFGNVLSVAFSPDGKTLAKSDEQGWVSLWQIETGKQLLFFKAHGNWVFSVAFSPDGATLGYRRARPHSQTLG
ncbi:pentapeptide repeat-containing protein [Kovacikia minuta CCNUW1]|uniref:WD40 repeat domain-containing protein n=1 Tax=Kovacikia minuta TaxID=2931930 RepID=UPI001CCAABA9|nr:pentapeptide repeat-containing protein [Kovacikia minuta]UBF25149.1 pentapeptide repeat-containing protein [Kovacikia minuta CCNUW1]